VWPRRVGWLHDISRVRHVLGRGVRDKATAAVAAVPGHLSERSGEPVQTDLARRGWRSDEGQRRRTVHALRKQERRTISPAPMSRGMGTGSALGWINLTTCDSSGASPRWLVLPFTLRYPEGQRITDSIGKRFQSSRNRRQPKPIPARVESFRGWDRPHGSDRELHHGGVHRGRADPRVELVSRRLHAWTLEERSPVSQPVGNTLLSQDVSGCFRTCQSHRMPPPAACPNAPAAVYTPRILALPSGLRGSAKLAKT